MREAAPLESRIRNNELKMVKHEAFNATTCLVRKMSCFGFVSPRISKRKTKRKSQMIFLMNEMDVWNRICLWVKQASLVTCQSHTGLGSHVEKDYILSTNLEGQ